MAPPPLTPVRTSYIAPLDLFAELRASHSETAGIRHSVLELPAHGVISIPADASAPWRDGLAKASFHIAAFTGDIARGSVPKPISPPLRTISPRAVLYVSPLTLLTNHKTVMGAIGITERLCELLLVSRSTICPCCSTSVTLFPTDADLADHIDQEWNGRDMALDVRGPSSLCSWAEAKGFTYSSSAHEEVTIRIDSLRASRERIIHLLDVLRSILKRPNVVIRCHNSESYSQYAIGGMCSSCGFVLPALSKATLQALLDTSDDPTTALPPGVAQRTIRNTALTRLLSAPLSSLTDVDELISTTLLSHIKTLELEHLSLGTPLKRLSARALASLCVTEALGDRYQPEAVAVIDLPGNIFDRSKESTHRRLITQHAASRLFVILGAEVGDVELPPSVPSPHAESLAQIHLSTTSDKAPTPITIPRGGHIVIQNAEPQRDGNLAQYLYEQLSAHSSSSVSLVPLYGRVRRSGGLIAHALGFAEPLATLFARSQDALAHGLDARSLLIGSSLRSSGQVCQRCEGSGVLLMSNDDQPTSPDATPCPLCGGSRLRAPASTVRFKGTSLGQLFNGTVSEALPTLRTLPKKTAALQLIEVLELLHLPLGIPVALLEPAERRLVQLVAGILRGTRTKPSVIVVEEASVGFSKRQMSGLRTLLMNRTDLIPHSGIILVDSCSHK